MGTATAYAADIPSAPPVPSPVPPARAARRLLERALRMDRLEDLCARLRDVPAGFPFVERVLAELGVSYQTVRPCLDRIPASGPVMAVANHPFGGVEGLILAHLLLTVRQDVKIVANGFLTRVAQLRPLLIAVNPFGGAQATRENVLPLRECLRWMEQGGILVVFPAGEVSHFDFREGRVRDPAWNEIVARLVRHARAAVLPVFFEGANSPFFHLAGIVHPRLRTALLPREILNKANRTIKVHVGQRIPFEQLDRLGCASAMVGHMRMRVHLLGQQRASRRRGYRRRPDARAVPVAAAGHGCLLASEIASLPPGQRLIEHQDYLVAIAGAAQIPRVLCEIGRLRELTFRAVGEGTGRSLDLDRFDKLYQHLFIWNRASAEVVGAYRLGLTDALLPEHGQAGLYTTTLFRYRGELLDRLNPAMELGRSFVRQEYQRGYLPLMLLWKGIGRFVAGHPRYRLLFGTVSMSNDYMPASRGLLAGYFDQDHVRPDWSRWVKPRRPIHPAKDLRRRRWEGGPVIADADMLDGLIREIEPDGKGLPVLVRQYLRLGGRVMACNVDPRFSDALDALVVVDLVQAPRRLLEQYLGPETAGYLEYHATAPRVSAAANPPLAPSRSEASTPASTPAACLGGRVLASWPR